MKKHATPKLKTPVQRRREQERQFKPLALELGWITYEWNRLQETLAELFSDTLGGDPNIAFKVWHSVRSDLTQREMLRAAVDHKSATATVELKPAWDEALWLIKEATDLSYKRNDALHAPLAFITLSDKIEILPLHFFGNPKAKKLAPKELLKEFQWYRASGAVLADYAMDLHYSIIAPEHFPLRGRPVLPSLGQKATPTRSPRRKKPKSTLPQPQS
jgi:hypothetical protein